MYDARGQGIKAAYDFVILNHKKHPVIIGVATDDKQFIEALKQIIREMDRQGYENIVLLLNDKKEDAKDNRETHDVNFYKNGDLIGGISKINGEWWLVVETVQNLTAIAMEKEKADYPLSVIRTKIRTTHDESGAENFVTSFGD